jgi:CubicO group peptidase (beta-lactamase class C family)
MGDDARARALVDAEVGARGATGAPPGVAVGVWRRGSPPAVYCAGVRDVATGAPVTADTVFRIGSVTKLLTATAVLLLRDEGRVDLDDPAVRHVPELARAHGAAGAAERITLRQLLTHTSGLPRVNDLGKRTDRSIEEAELLDSLARVALQPPGTLSYSNLGYQVLGLVVGRVTGGTHARYVRDALLEPLGMRATVWQQTDVPPQALASGYRRRAPLVERIFSRVLGAGAGRVLSAAVGAEPSAPEPHWQQGAACGSGGLYSTVMDCLRFAALYMPGAGLSVPALLSPRSLSEALTLAVLRARSVARHRDRAATADAPSGAARAQAVIGTPAGPPAETGERGARGVGLGWHRAPHRRAGDVWWHNGGSEGYTAMLQIAPRAGIAIAVLTNRARGDYAGPDRLAKHVLEATLGA